MYAVHGFTLLEIMIATCIIGVLVGIAIPNYLGYRERARVAVAVTDLKNIEKSIINFFTTNDAYPDSLADIGLDGFRDPWTNPYQYLRIDGGSINGKGNLRKDHFMVPVNTDFDLYSMGKDGDSKPPFTAKASQDDIVRAFNGSYYGMVSDM